MKKALFLLKILIFIIFIFYFSIRNHESYSEEEIKFIINKPYLAVVGDLAKKDSLEKTIQDNDGKLIYKNWEYFVVEIPKKILRIKDYKLEGQLNFAIEKQDSDLGLLELPFEQKVHINKNIFTINTNLIEVQKNITLYKKSIEITPSVENSFQTQVEIKSELRVQKLIPFFFSNFMDKKVIENNKKSLNKLKMNLLNITQNFSPVLIFKP